MAAPAKPSALGKLPLAAKIGVGLGLTVLVGVAYFVMGYSEVSSQIAAAKQQETKLRTDLADARESESAYLKDLAELTDKQQRQRELNKILPEAAEYPSFLSALQGVANVTGVSLNSWDPMDEVPQQFFAKVPMRLTLGGRFHQIAKFFYGVGQLDRIINLENITMSEPKREGDDVTVKTECLATAFHTIAPRASASAAPGKPPAPPAPAPPGGGK
jgi:type IV pilus assembly protein PilO